MRRRLLLLGFLSAIAGSLPHASVSAQTRLVFRSVSVSDFHVCALEQSGGIYCWGSNTYGVLGTGSQTASSAPVRALSQLPADWIAVNTAVYHTCALRRDNRLFCWGQNQQGQLGTGSTSVQELAAVPVTGGLLFWSLARGGTSSTCAVQRVPGLAVLSTYPTLGAMYCWGYNGAGELGVGSAGSRTTPTRADSSGVSGGLRFINAMSLGRDFGCGTVLVSGKPRVACWGNGTRGQLGRLDILTQLKNGTMTYVPTPGLVGTSLSLHSVVTGAWHACALETDSAGPGASPVHCWGRNDNAQLTSQYPANVWVPSPLRDGTAPLRLKAMAAGSSHTCGIAATGVVYCWGDNSLGQVGNGSPYSRETSPKAVGTGWNLTFKSISAAGNTTCGITTNDVLYCWGDNSRGQLGNGASTGMSRLPIKVLGQ